MTEKKRAPEIRFEGFEDDWEQRKFGSIAALSRGLTYSPACLVDASRGVRVLRSSNINEDSFELHDDDVFVREDAVNIENCRDGDILITAANGSSRLVGKRAIIAGLTGRTVHGGFMLRAKTCEPDFLNASMGSKWYRQFLGRGVSGGNGALGNLDKKALEKCKLMLPGRDERDAIGSFFRDLDDLIVLHQRKHEKLCRVKTALLGKMFPKPGSDAPELRFPGFTDSWEQRKLGEFYEFKNGLNKSKEFFGHGTPIVNFTDVFNNRGLTASSLNGRVELTRAEIKTFEVCQGDIFFTRTSETIEEIGYPSVMLDQPKRTAFSGFVIRGRAANEDPLSNDFKRYVFFTNAFRREMTKKSSMTTRALTSGTALRKMAFAFPANKDEQSAIGALFSRLDDLITLHQRKLETLRKVKKSLLGKMFA